MHLTPRRTAVAVSLLASGLPATASVLELPVLFRNTYAVVEMEVGTPPVSHYLRFDTGSATTWIVDKECAESTCNNYSGYPRKGYNANDSSTAGGLHTYASIGYLGGATTGSGVFDEFNVPSVPSFRWSQTFMEANASSWAQDPADGFLGLAFTDIADAGTQTVVETLMRTNKLDKPRFGLYYGKEFVDTKGPGQGAITIGGSEEDKYVDGELAWLDVQKVYGTYQLWRSTMAGIKTHRRNCTVPKQHEYNNSWAVFDTGAGGITVPTAYAHTLYESIGMNLTAILKGEHIPKCSEFKGWSVDFEFGDPANPTVVTLKAEQLARPGFADGSPEHCYPPFDPGDDSDGLFLFGTPFLHQLYTVYDFYDIYPTAYKPRVGFGQLKEEYRP